MVDSYGSEEYLLNLTPSTLTAKAGESNTFEIKKPSSTTTSAELTVGAAAAGATGWNWGLRVVLKDRKFKFAKGEKTNFMQVSTCVNDGVTAKPFRCNYVLLIG